MLPNWRRYLLSDRWGGYAKSAWDVDFLHNPILAPVIWVIWFVSGAILASPNSLSLPKTVSIEAALVNLAFSYYYFIYMRWKGVLRGGGAPGFMTFWTAAAVFLLEWTSAFAPDAHGLALLALQTDFAWIMISAGIAKVAAGYAKNDGMELGLVNPMWSYWWKRYSKLSPRHWIFRFYNQAAWLTEIVAGVLMLIPRTRLVGAFLIASSFVFIAAQIRLGTLCWMVISCAFLFMDMSTGASGVGRAFVVHPLLSGTLAIYIFLRPTALAGLCWNFYFKKRLPGLLQKALDSYANLFGIILWRVFTADVTNFVIQIFRLAPNGAETEISCYGNAMNWRFNDVMESVAIASIFTTLKYFSGNWELFSERLLRYAKTLGFSIRFQYACIVKADDKFKFIPMAEYVVDGDFSKVAYTLLDSTRSSLIEKAAAYSPVHGTLKQGSYAPGSSN